MSKTKQGKELCFFALFERFINDSKRGKRLQPNGKRITAGTIKNYCYTKRLLEKFCQQKKFHLRLRLQKRLNQREHEAEKGYWKKFYRQFTTYMYKDCGYFDNYAGQNIKIIKTFFNYLNKELALGIGEFHRLFYARKEEITIFPLLPEELNFFIYNKEFETALSTRMRQVKDVFVFGCTVALRVSDLLGLQKSNLRIVAGQHYLAVRSRKTSTDTLVKLPDYAINIVHKYSKVKKSLLPSFHKANLNKNIKRMFEQAGFTHQLAISRERAGVAVELKKGKNSRAFRFCDVVSTHTMRRTAITTMLCLGMPEQLVRRISGHAPHTKEFYRYVRWAQAYLDQESDKFFEKLKDKKWWIPGGLNIQ